MVSGIAFLAVITASVTAAPLILPREGCVSCAGGGLVHALKDGAPGRLLRRQTDRGTRAGAGSKAIAQTALAVRSRTANPQHGSPQCRREPNERFLGAHARSRGRPAAVLDADANSPLIPSVRIGVPRSAKRRRARRPSCTRRPLRETVKPALARR